MSTMKRPETIEIPEDLYLQILKIVSGHSEYKNVTDFVVVSLRKEIERVTPVDTT